MTINKSIRQALYESKKFNTKRSKYLLNNLTDKEKKTSLVNSKLESLQKIFKPTNYESSRMLDFFDGQHIYTYTKNVSLYFNNIMQFNMIDFFTKKGFEIVEEFSVKNGDMVTYPSKVKITYDIGKTFDAYVKATIFWENKKTKQKFAISVEYNEFEECYTIDIFYCNNTLENILQEWEKFSKTNNFYKNKKIDGSCNFLAIKESTNWSDVILPNKIRETIRRNVENKLKFKDIIKKNNISMKQGIVLSGNPGCVIKGTKIKIRKKKEKGKHNIIDNNIQIREETEIEIQDFFKLSKNEDIYEIETPQGWVEIGDLVLKHGKECYLIRTKNGRELGGSEDHYVETTNGWKSFKNLDVQNTTVFTNNGNDTVIAKEYIGIEDTYDLEVKNNEHKYYANGIVSHNTGKTVICRTLAKELPISVLYVLPSHLNAPNGIQRICEMAKDLAPTLLILEDIDYIAKDRDEFGDNWQSIELMNKLDGIEEFGDIITIATTNLIEKVEKAMKNRPGRFDRVIEIPLPNEECRKAMFVKFTENFILQNIDINKLAAETKGLSGAYIKNICETAALLAIDRGRVDKDNKITIIETDFCDAINEINDEELSGCSDFKKNTGNTPPIGFNSKKK